MLNYLFRFFIICLVCILCGSLFPAEVMATTVRPFDPPKVGAPEGYVEFQGSYDYPTDSPPPPSGGYPWTQTLKGSPISKETAPKYLKAVKNYIAEDMISLLSDTGKKDKPSDWKPAQKGWYNEPWLSKIRGGIHGVYTGSQCFSPVLFPKSQLKEPFTTYVYVLYNDVAGTTLQHAWGKSGMAPSFETDATQFPEGSIIVKVALSTATAEEWEPMDGALSWDIYTQPSNCPTEENEHPNEDDNPKLFPVNFFQFDINIKDSIAAPETGWVFSTLTYDKDVPVKSKTVENIWNDKMVFLGAMWGNDPEVTTPGDTLSETWINPDAPVYATETLGWGGRLSGPNDAAVQNPPYYICSGEGCDPRNPDKEKLQYEPVGGKNLEMSSCISCHSTGQFVMESFLLPTPLAKVGEKGTPVPLVLPGPDSSKEYFVFYEEGSSEWMTWFQNRSGNKPKDAGATAATDYDMNIPFKSLAYWAANVCNGNPSPPSACNVLQKKIKALGFGFGSNFEFDYRGMPIITKPDNNFEFDYQGMPIITKP